ncbi:MAG TPA: hypothetical protein DDZ99_05375 [Clostridiales bacterium]|nr:hypothetical protein [Clostridiales bacterium]
MCEGRNRCHPKKALTIKAFFTFFAQKFIACFHGCENAFFMVCDDADYRSAFFEGFWGLFYGYFRKVSPAFFAFKK